MSKELIIYVVEDDEWYRELLAYNLGLIPEYKVQKFETATACLEAIQKQLPDAITLDYRLPDMDGDKVLQEIKKLDPEIEVIVISEQEKIDTAVELLKLGAYDYIVKTKDIRDRLLNTISHIGSKAKLQTRIRELEEEVGKKYSFEKSIIGQSAAIRRVFDLLEKAARTNITVTITGETGTGKELVARSVHYNSPRSKGPFVAVNMAAIPQELVESELFGHEKGAFTGASNQRIGKFEEANGGTLFLDEIGEMDPSIQAKLLRALQEKEVSRVGSNKVIKTDCRIVVATNRDLEKEVKEKNFREDLYFRLFGLTIQLPPLRERDKDIILLANYFLESFCRENGMPDKKISREARKKLMAYNYPGNIRELKSVIELSAVMADDLEIQPGDISFGTSQTMNITDMSTEKTLREHTLDIVKYYLKQYEDNVKLVAKKLDVSYSTIYRMLKEEAGEE